MKTIFFIRHAKSSWKDPSLADIDRPLNKRGKKAGPLMAGKLKEKISSLDLILTSPATRARITADYFAEKFKLSGGKFREDPKIYHGDVEEYIDCIRQIGDDGIQSVALFGHNPTLTFLANEFSDHDIENVPTAGILHIESDIKKWSDFDPSNSRLVGFYFPKQYV